MDEDDKRRLLVASVLEWTSSTTLDPRQYEEYVTDLWTRGKITTRDLLDLLKAYTDHHLPD